MSSHHSHTTSHAHSNYYAHLLHHTRTTDELSRHGVETLTLYETFPSDLGPNNYTYSVNVLEPNEANCDPQVSRTCDISTTHCNVTVTFRCASAGQTRIRLSFQDFKRGDDSTKCQDVSTEWTKTHGSALIVGTSSGDLTNVVMDGVATRSFDSMTPDDQLYSQDAYTSNLTFWFAIKNGSIPYTQKQDFFGSGIDISAVGTGGASLVLDHSGSLYDTVATGLYVVFFFKQF